MALCVGVWGRQEKKRLKDYLTYASLLEMGPEMERKKNHWCTLPNCIVPAGIEITWNYAEVFCAARGQRLATAREICPYDSSDGTLIVQRLCASFSFFFFRIYYLLLPLSLLLLIFTILSATVTHAGGARFEGRRNELYFGSPFPGDHWVRTYVPSVWELLRLRVIAMHHSDES